MQLPNWTEPTGKGAVRGLLVMKPDILGNAVLKYLKVDM